MAHEPALDDDGAWLDPVLLPLVPGLLPAEPAAPASAPAPVPAAPAPAPAPAPEPADEADPPRRATRQRRPRVKAEEPEDDVEERKRRRLALNRESARECRRRKRELTLALEKRQAALQAENERLRGCLLLKERDQQALEEQKAAHEARLAQLIGQGADDALLEAEMRSFKETYADYGDQRTMAVQFHMAQLERLLLPTQVTKMIMWSLQQDPEFWREGPESLSVILGKAVGLTAEQRDQFMAWREPIRDTSRALKQSLDLVGRLKAGVDAKTRNFNASMDDVQAILTPTQAAKFVLWVSRNPSCAEALSRATKASVHDPERPEAPSSDSGGSSSALSPPAAEG